MRIEDERAEGHSESGAGGGVWRSGVIGGGLRGGPCLTEEEVLAFSEGSLLPSAIEALHAHLDDCPLCLELVNAAVHRWDAPPAGGAGERPWMATFGPGQTIADRYQVEGFIGRGGMGEVYLAFDAVLHERVALKTLLSTISDSAQAVARLLSEARLARRISHPNVCRVHDVGVHVEPGRVDERLHFLTMEYIDGQRLGQLVRGGPLPLPLVVEIARQILSGIGAAHAAGVLHRDLKSDNVMVSSAGAQLRVAVMDFGLSKALESGGGPCTRERVGSVAYMPPEQVLGLELGPAADLYAFGVVLFEMLCERLPFTGDRLQKHRPVRRLADLPALPTQLRPELPPEADQLLLRCLMDEPGARFASADEARASLEEALGALRPSGIVPAPSPRGSLRG